MLYNSVIDVQDNTTGTITEPVTLAECKAYMRLSNTDEDTLISSLIKAARELIEKYTGLSLIRKTQKIIVNNSLGNIAVPYGPYVDADITATGTDVIVKKRNKRIVIESPLTDSLELTCIGGYTSATIPEALKTAIKEQVNYMFMQRDNIIPVKGLGDKAKQYAAPFKDVSWLL